MNIFPSSWVKAQMRRCAIFAARVLLPSMALLLCLGCAQTRSISDSGFRGRSHYNPHYRGELSEFDVVGIPPGTNITETQIQEALKARPVVKFLWGDPVLLIQSGAPAPDHEFVREFERYFAVAPFSGQPAPDMNGYAARLRLAAAQGGYKHLACYWGVLEASQEDHATKTISWVPIAGSLVPDQSQRMRIRLKAVAVDVATGRWKMIQPPPVEEDARLSAKLNRESSDQKQVARLKQAGYRALASAIADATR
jgi:hypothetical protein